MSLKSLTSHSPVKVLTQSERFIEEAIGEHEQFVRTIKEAKDHAFNSGLALLNAQRALAPGESFGDVLAAYDNRLPRRTAFHYKRFASDMLEWAALEKPRLQGDKLTLHARAMALQSAMGFLELCRHAAGILRPNEGGGYRSERHAGKQLWFSFDTFNDLFWSLDQQDFKPLDQVAPDKLQETRTLVAKTLEHIDGLLAAQPGASAANRALPESPRLTPPKNFVERAGVITPVTPS